MVYVVVVMRQWWERCCSWRGSESDGGASGGFRWIKVTWGVWRLRSNVGGLGGVGVGAHFIGAY